MNKANILAVADAIEQHSIPALGFNMRDWHTTGKPDLSGHNCGTTACIGGWAEAVAELKGDPSEASKFLELPKDIANDLFYPGLRGLDEALADSDPYSATSAQAVAVLRHLAETGEVDWSIANRADGA